MEAINMKPRTALLIIAACFLIAGYVDSPDYHSFETDKQALIKQARQSVEKPVYNSAVPVYIPSPILWR
jgi:predicted aminopeptidase